MEDSFLLVLSECSQSYLAILKLLLRSLPEGTHRGRPGISNCHLKVNPLNNLDPKLFIDLILPRTSNR